MEEEPGDTARFNPPMFFPNLWPLGHTVKLEYTITHTSGAPPEDAQLEAKFAAFQDVTVPAGAFADCVRLEVTVQTDGQWAVRRVTMSRSARVLMEGWVRVPPQ